MGVRRGLVRRERQELLAIVGVPLGEFHGPSVDGGGIGVSTVGVPLIVALHQFGDQHIPLGQPGRALSHAQHRS